MDIIITTGAFIGREYQVVDVVFAMEDHTGGFLSNADPNKAFDGVKKQLEKKCKGLKADAVVDCQFDYRVAVSKGLVGNKQVFEIFAYGTAVRFI